MNNRKIIDYIICWDDLALNLEDSIRLSLEKDYQPFGGLCINKDGFFCQAMVKYEDETVSIDKMPTVQSGFDLAGPLSSKEVAIWYVRDRTKCKRLTHQLDFALAELAVEFEADPYGMLTQGEEERTIWPIHANGRDQREEFMTNARAWLIEALKK